MLWHDHWSLISCLSKFHNLFFRTSSSSVTKIPDSGGYLDPETGDWVSTCTNSRGDLNNSEEENSRHSSSRAAKNTQVGFVITHAQNHWWRLSVYNLFLTRFKSIGALITHFNFQFCLFLYTFNVSVYKHDCLLVFSGKLFFLHIMRVHGSLVC